MPAIYITAIRLSQTNATHEHITHIWFSTSMPTYSASDSPMTIDQIVAWLSLPGNVARVMSLVDFSSSEVEVVRRPNKPSFIKTQPDKSLRDNLLSLPTK